MAKAKSPWSLSWVMRGLPSLSADHATDHSVADYFHSFRPAPRSGVVMVRRSQKRQVLVAPVRAGHRSDRASAGLVFVESGRRELIHQRHKAVDLPRVWGRGNGCSTRRGTQPTTGRHRSEEHTAELQSRGHLVCRRLLDKKKHTVEVANVAPIRTIRRNRSQAAAEI